MAKTAKTAEIAKTAETGNSDDPLALLKNKGQGRAGSDFYILLVKLKNSCKNCNA